MRVILRWRTRILLFLSTLTLFIMFQGAMVPRPEEISSGSSSSGNLATTPENDFYSSTEEDSPQFIEPALAAKPEQAPEPPHQNYLLGSSSFVSQLPRIQREPSVETDSEKAIREARRDSVKEGFKHAWRGYSKCSLCVTGLV
jgi:hypothetical protein